MLRPEMTGSGLCGNKIHLAALWRVCKMGLGWGGVGWDWGEVRIDVETPGVHRRQSEKPWLELG